MDGRERFRTVLEGGVPDRIPFQDAYWRSTIERWRREGLPANVDPQEYFGCQMARLSGDYTLQFPLRELEHSERYRVYVDADGATRQEMAAGDDWTPHWLDFTIKNREDWEKHRARAFYNPSRVPQGVEEVYRRARQQGKFVAFQAHACFHPTWHKIGLERLLVALIEDPGWIAEMFAAHTRLIIDLYEGFKAREIAFDGAWLSDDLGYCTAPLISPQMYCQQVQPFHQWACAHFARDGLKTILHSDGNVGPLIPHFLEAGFAALHPLEAKAGLDVRQLKKKYGSRLVLFGNIDVRKLAGTRAEVEEEVRTKVSAGKEGGGYIFHSDHSVPSNVPLDNYRFALEVLEKYGRYE
jgi:uroporphyrinogen decarboxylase